MTSIVEYVKNKKGEKIGILYAEKIEDTVFITTAKVRTTKGDVFNREIGMKIVKGRIQDAKNFYLNNGKAICDIPLSFQKPEIIQKFVKRCEKYFKTQNIF